MERYIVNETMHGYNNLSVDSEDYSNIKNSLIVVIIDKTEDNKFRDYYKMIDCALRNINRVFLISVDDGNKLFRPLASLMTTYKGYDIYQIKEKTDISIQYLLTLEERNPDYNEVQTYVGGDVTAFSDLTTLLFGIESLVDEGSQDKLKDFLENHMSTLECLTSTLNNMKKTCDLTNNKELIDKINETNNINEKLKNTLDKKDTELSKIKHEKEEYEVQNLELTKKQKKLELANKELNDKASDGGAVIRTYKEIQLPLIKCTTKLILYFKEISYVQYTNSLVVQLLNILLKYKLNTKLLIYDANTDLYQTYNPLNTITGENFASMKANINKSSSFVVGEPNPSILQSVLESDKRFDVVIIYDRLRCEKSLVVGNNVTTFYVINSSKDYIELKPKLKFDTQHIITRPTCNITESNGAKRFLSVPTIDDYYKSSSSSKTNKYMRAVSPVTNELLVEAIFRESKISTLTQ